MVTGPRRAGKSTICAAALAASHQVLSDDSLLCWLDRGASVVAPFRRFLSFRRGSLHVLPPVLRNRLGCIRMPEEERWLHPLPASSLAQSGRRLSTLWFTRVDERTRKTTITPLGKGHALAALLNSTSVLFLSGKYVEEAAALLHVMVATVEQARSFEVVLGEDLLRHPDETLGRLIETSESA
ncbi:MAG: hypothetical protein HRF46_12435 [Acidobacteriota bacterium]|jgi:hypothetical protein